MLNRCRKVGSYTYIRRRFSKVGFLVQLRLHKIYLIESPVFIRVTFAAITCQLSQLRSQHRHETYVLQFHNVQHHSTLGSFIGMLARVYPIHWQSDSLYPWQVTSLSRSRWGLIRDLANAECYLALSSMDYSPSSYVSFSFLQSPHFASLAFVVISRFHIFDCWWQIHSALTSNTYFFHVFEFDNVH